MNYYLFVFLLVWFFKTEYSHEDKANHPPAVKNVDNYTLKITTFHKTVIILFYKGMQRYLIVGQ